MKKKELLIIVACILIAIIMAPILVDSISINFLEKAPFSRISYWKPQLNNGLDCNCMGQKMHKGFYYEIYHNSDKSHHDKPFGLIPLIGTRCKFRFILDAGLIYEYVLFGIK